ncbi:hypothetical protein [Actinomadura montaniterrae]|uniref:Uncharacterized protein n=1 Tax=Actinomadura montaniterrae TaxID=1803903 RepID=A0A6L3VU96_9ACTN|nr:hypothetical protein [Actinomadura montaniterrae]KAB2379288.1 hypothetical protein F9B16_20975 [Actinomadura montaniterrae]
MATAVLSRVIPGSTGFTPDQIPGLSVNRWRNFPIDDRDPDEVTTAFLEYCRPRVTGLLIIVTEGSFSTGAGPFFVADEYLDEFAATYPDLIGEPLVAGDTVVVSTATGRVIVVQHDGWIDMLRGIVPFGGVHPGNPQRNSPSAAPPRAASHVAGLGAQQEIGHAPRASRLDGL